ncbi:toll-like receptor 4 [Mytilus galloprovincialis]|uniref:Toll-like receptor 4 n=1 Tax=Mytilus galloprovincialis TaxID=29158 RepID=A0A8B6DW03_MYTGA|nr:toll-like receptor 4 [Mytilus galloprovincialis]
MEHALLCNFILMLFVLCSYFLYAKGIAYQCKENLKRGKLHVDCSNKGLLNLIFSGIPQVPSNAFSLNLQHNSIHIIRNKDLRHMTNLTVLDLSYNRLSYISGDAFNGLEKLQQLRLNNNELDYRHYETTRSFQPLKSLKLLSIENNAHLSYFPEEALAYLTKLEIFKVDLPKFSSISMSLNLGKEYRKLTHLHSLYLNGEAMILSSAVVIYKRWKLRYLYYTAKMKYTSIENGDEDSREYDYDAFISYSDEDRMFVINDCIKNLEQDRNLKLCIHERDFIPGHDITNNIVRAIQTSRKTICIITRSFLKSDFCMFELNMAKMESTHSRNGKNILVLVFNEKLSSKDLPLHLYEHIQKQSYLQYQNNEIANAFFWEKINDAIYA